MNEPVTASSPASSKAPVAVAALYRFASLNDAVERRAPLQALCDGLGVRGILLLAAEGVNGTIAGAPDAVAAVVAHLRAFPSCNELDVKWSQAPEMPFVRMKVRLKREIVTLGVPGVDPVGNAGTYVEPEDWNALLAAPDVTLVDTRNAYEVAIGTFRGALDPKTATFRDFPDWVDEMLDPARHKRVAMFCTGGIRCEKATALLKARGFTEVYHLRGGILRYLEVVPAADSLWDGDCFVFDRRVSVGHGLALGHHKLCSVCRNPMPAEVGGGYASEDCPDCVARAGQERRERALERRRQIRIAAARGEEHLGPRRATGRD